VKIDEFLLRFTQLHPKSIDLSLGRISRLLDRLGDPQRELPPVVHVAGTNGKGSVVADLRAILEHAGRRVHCYTSPHLMRFNERIRLATGLIEDRELEALFDECDRANGSEPITFFEITTVAAFLAFSRHPADYVLLEVGLGGRLDTTNVCETTALSVITPISYDHQRFLGDTLDAIAREKAGIMRQDVPTIVAPQPDEAMTAIAAVAETVRSPLYVHGRDWSYDSGPPLQVRLGDCAYAVGPLALTGAHQQANASLAAAAALLLRDPAVDPTALSSGLAAATWPARLQRLETGALRDLLPTDAELWLDGGHNEGAATVLADWIAANATDGRATHAIIGMMQTKDAARFFSNLRGKPAQVLCVPIPGEENAFAPDDIVALAVAAGLNARPCDSVAAALSLVARADARPRVLICGSLYLAGTVLRANGNTIA